MSQRIHANSIYHTTHALSRGIRNVKVNSWHDYDDRCLGETTSTVHFDPRGRHRRAASVEESQGRSVTSSEISRSTTSSSQKRPRISRSRVHLTGQPLRGNNNPCNISCQRLIFAKHAVIHLLVDETDVRKVR